MLSYHIAAGRHNNALVWQVSILSNLGLDCGTDRTPEKPALSVLCGLSVIQIPLLFFFRPYPFIAAANALKHFLPYGKHLHFLHTSPVVLQPVDNRLTGISQKQDAPVVLTLCIVIIGHPVKAHRNNAMICMLCQSLYLQINPYVGGIFIISKYLLSPVSSDCISFISSSNFSKTIDFPLPPNSFNQNNTLAHFQK